MGLRARGDKINISPQKPKFYRTKSFSKRMKIFLTDTFDAMVAGACLVLLVALGL